jgi:hypothetical protein
LIALTFDEPYLLIFPLWRKWFLFISDGFSSILVVGLLEFKKPLPKDGRWSTLKLSNSVINRDEVQIMIQNKTKEVKIKRFILDTCMLVVVSSAKTFHKMFLCSSYQKYQIPFWGSAPKPKKG